LKGDEIYIPTTASFVLQVSRKERNKKGTSSFRTRKTNKEEQIKIVRNVKIVGNQELGLKSFTKLSQK